MNSQSIRCLWISAATALVFATPAWALDGNDVLKKLNAAYKLQGIEFASKAIAVDGKDITLTGAVVTIADAGPESIALGDVSLEGVVENNGGYTISAINFEDLDYTADDTRIVATDLVMKNIIIPATVNAHSIDGMLFYEEASASDFEMHIDKHRVLSVDSIHSAMTKDEKTGALGGEIVLDDFTLDLTDVKTGTADETLQKMQLEMIKGTFTAAGTWNIKTGDLDLEAVELSLANIGTLTMSFGITGYTTQFVESLQELAKEQTGPEASAELAALGAIGMAQELGIKSLLVHFEDDSITERIIDLMAGEQNIKPADFKGLIKALVPSFVEQLNIPTLQAQIIEALNSYIDNPQTLSIVAAPKAPVMVPELMGTALGAPETLPAVLGLSVTAND